MRTLVLQGHGTSGRTCSIIVQRVLQRQVLEIVVGATVLEDGGLADTFFLDIGLVLDDGSLHALSYQRDVMTGNLGEHGFS